MIDANILLCSRVEARIAIEKNMNERSREITTSAITMAAETYNYIKYQLVANYSCFYSRDRRRAQRSARVIEVDRHHNEVPEVGLSSEFRRITLKPSKMSFESKDLCENQLNKLRLLIWSNKEQVSSPNIIFIYNVPLFLSHNAYHFRRAATH